MIHQLKIESEFFQAKLEGLKPFEVRKNDRNFRVGDFLALNEVTPSLADTSGMLVETGRCCIEEIMYIIDDPAFVESGYVIISTWPCVIRTRNQSPDFEHAQDFQLARNPFKVACYGSYRMAVHDES